MNDEGRASNGSGMWLMVRSGAAAGTRLEITDRLTLGRDAGCELVVDDGKVSRRHAAFSVDAGGRVFLQDLGSTNGTFVDGRQITGRVPLAGREIVRLGDTELALSPADGERTVAAPVPAAMAPPVMAPATMAASPRRSHRRLVVVLAILVVLFSIANVTVHSYAQRVAARETARSLQLSKVPGVTLKGFPFLIRALIGRLREVDLHGQGLTARGVPVERFDLFLHDVTFSTRQLLSDRAGQIHVGEGDGTVALSADALSALLRKAGIPLHLDFGGGRVKLQPIKLPNLPQLPGLPDLTQLGQNASASFGVRGSALDIRPTGVSLPSGFPTNFSLDLPDFVPGIRYIDVKVEGDVLVLSFRVAELTLNVPKG